MKPHTALLMSAAAALALSACAAPRQGPPARVIDRVLANAPGKAQPSTIVATETAYARDAREIGQFTAAARYAASGALLHGRNGPVAFSSVAGALDDADGVQEWGPRTVVMSCDGELALSVGRFRDKDGFVGNYVTTWVRQSDDRYKWSYDVAGRDDPQPPPRETFEDGDIVVTALDSILGLVATCPREGETVPPPPAIPIGSDGAGDAQLSRDRTLRWRWEHRPDGTKFVAADYYYNGEWVTAVEEGLASPPKQ
ncbi:hypothetical protein [Erythrobacter sp. JK5]|uniref:hypothetical protein n=1 Tax=Erythrobacter sp. JK5 TaxID=2829500 RepID=UPI001BAA6333|nr:hypothetical protein [Erythrobacter sp. JK5]QUL37010.1 hypothetical protein KDC96_11475 [Erythrobacter sp. JK5]